MPTLSPEETMPIPFTRVLKYLWLLLFLLWIPIAPLGAMAFDGGYTIEAYVFVWSLWTYPLCLLVAVHYERKMPGLMYLPFLNVFGTLIAGSFPWK